MIHSTDNRKTTPLFVVGLQKSGTSLLNRMLLACDDYFYSPFNLEGREFWGDDPPFSPVKPPCGVLYQNKKAANGHTLNASDYQMSDQQMLLDAVNCAQWKQPIWINKNPYNSVRIGWLKSMFPGSRIVAIMRQPEANVYSLMKKFIPHENRGMGPEQGWWGVKPEAWQNMINDNKYKQISQQWQAVNQHIIKHRSDIDWLVDYTDVCRHPSVLVNKILLSYGIQAQIKIDPFPDMNHEYRTGARLLSMNRELKKMKDQFDLSGMSKPTAEIKKMPWIERLRVRKNCYQTWKQCLKHRTRL